MSVSFSSYKNIGITVQSSTLSVAPKPRRKESEKLAAKGSAVHSRRPGLQSPKLLSKSWKNPCAAHGIARAMLTAAFADPLCHCDQWRPVIGDWRTVISASPSRRQPRGRSTPARYAAPCQPRGVRGKHAALLIDLAIYPEPVAFRNRSGSSTETGEHAPPRINARY